ncbi:MAG: hypothetical protein HY289_01010 [Planctomycetes bacterium]|nr:hypothetical protein [Planctomycetota bacterium]
MRRSAIIAILVFVPCTAAQPKLGKPEAPSRTQVFFQEPKGMQVFWLTKQDGKVEFSKVPLEAPGRFNFVQGAVYRLRLTRLPGHPGRELFPTLDVPPVNDQTREFLTHNAVPITLTDEEIAQAVKGAFITKVVYLPAGKNGAGETAISSDGDAFRDALQRGNIVLVLRVGNIADPPGDKK